MNLRNIIFVFVILGYLTSCNFSEKKDGESESPINTSSNSDSLNSADVISKYKADINWDTLSFTYQIKDRFENNDSVSLAIIAGGVDIIKIDSVYYLKLRKQFRWFTIKESPYKEIILFLKISKNQLDDISRNMKILGDYSLGSENGCFIFKSNTINSLDVKLFDDIDTESSSKVISNKSVLVIKGTLIDYYLNRNSL